MCFVQTRAVALLSRVAVMCDDDTRLQRVVPYILVNGPSSLRSMKFISAYFITKVANECCVLQVQYRGSHESPATGQLKEQLH